MEKIINWNERSKKKKKKKKERKKMIEHHKKPIPGIKKLWKLNATAHFQMVTQLQDCIILSLCRISNNASLMYKLFV